MHFIVAIEKCLGWDYSKGSYVSMAIVNIRCKNKYKETHWIELKIDKIDEDKDKLEYIEELIKKISSSLESIKISKEGNSVMSLDNLHNISFSTESSTNNLPHRSFLLKFHMIGNTKGVF